MRFLYAALLLAVTTSSALAQREPQIVVPGRPGVPVYINGIDASWGVVEGEFGLDRPNQVAPVVVWRPSLISAPYRVPAYFPADGRRPRVGRLEIPPPPNRRLPPPAPTYFRTWTSESQPGPVTDYPQYPPMYVAPQIGGYGQHREEAHPGGDHKGP